VAPPSSRDRVQPFAASDSSVAPAQTKSSALSSAALSAQALVTVVVPGTPSSVSWTEESLMVIAWRHDRAGAWAGAGTADQLSAAQWLTGDGSCWQN
jgi:hypothetical protein